MLPLLVYPRQSMGKALLRKDFYWMHHEAESAIERALKTCGRCAGNMRT
jgi:hypothetical protein